MQVCAARQWALPQAAWCCKVQCTHTCLYATLGSSRPPRCSVLLSIPINMYLPRVWHSLLLNPWRQRLAHNDTQTHITCNTSIYKYIRCGEDSKPLCCVLGGWLALSHPVYPGQHAHSQG